MLRRNPDAFIIISVKSCSVKRHKTCTNPNVNRPCICAATPAQQHNREVPHQRLLSKLHFYGIQHSTLNWISSFLTNRTQQVTIYNIQTDQLPVDSGVPQGTVLGPILFLLFINDLPESVNSEIKLFADDCLMYRTINTHSDAITLQQYINKLEQWENTWQMEFNADKCFTIRITNSRHPIRVDYKIHYQHLNLLPDSKYLGVSFDQTLSWKTHINNVTAKAYRTLGFLRRNMTGCTKIVKDRTYKALIRPQLEYA